MPYVFGLCGHGNIGLIDAMYERQDDIATISVHHESVAGFTADVYDGYPASPQQPLHHVVLVRQLAHQPCTLFLTSPIFSHYRQRPETVSLIVVHFKKPIVITRRIFRPLFKLIANVFINLHGANKSVNGSASMENDDNWQAWPCCT